jgi:hypothetical protein
MRPFSSSRTSSSVSIPSLPQTLRDGFGQLEAYALKRTDQAVITGITAKVTKNQDELKRTYLKRGDSRAGSSRWMNRPFLTAGVRAVFKIVYAGMPCLDDV